MRKTPLHFYLITLISSLIICLFPVNLHAKPPPNPLHCIGNSCSINNGYGLWGDRGNCTSPKISYPRTEEDIRIAVANANKYKLKVKVVTKFSHTISKLACPSTRTEKKMMISTERYDSTIDINLKSMVVTADAGVPLRALINKVEGVGLSLVPSPYWEGVTVGGLLSTGAHGSSWWGRGAAVHDYIVGINLVVPASRAEGYAKVLKLKSNDTLLKAARVSLGVLGVISKVKLRLEPVFKRRVWYSFLNDHSLENVFLTHGRTNEFGDIIWYPSLFTATYKFDNRVPFATPGAGSIDFFGFHAQSSVLTGGTRIMQKKFEAERDERSYCAMAKTMLAYRKLIANGIKNDKQVFRGYPVVGTQGDMQASGSCLYSPPDNQEVSCAWDPSVKGISLYETTANFPVSKFADFVRDVKRLRDIVTATRFCGMDVFNGFLIRYIKASDAYLGQPEDEVALDYNYYRADDPMTPRLNQDVLEEIEQMAFFKYGARPHWAKNRVIGFTDVPRKYPQWAKFIEAKKKLDPRGIFSTEWSDEVLYGKSNYTGDGCALEGMCICSEDRHCSPSKGYLCKPGLLYTEARVCRYTEKK